MSIAKKPRFDADSTNFGKLGFGVNFDYAINFDDGIQDYEIGESLLRFGKTSMELMNTETQKMKMVCGRFYIPKNNPAKPHGEDAHFISEKNQTIGVADGVGGWAKRGVDAGEYARELMSNAFMSVHKSSKKRKAVDDMYVEEISAVDPTKVLDEAYAMTRENLALQGSSTACILSLDKERGVLNATNVGDSGFMVCRNNKVVVMSKSMQHRFNCPYQLANGGGGINDGPESAEEYELEGLLPGDIVVMGTDGLLDNMFKEEIEDALQVLMDRTGDLFDDREFCEMAAEIIATLALEHSEDEFFESPFSKEAAKAGLRSLGGKVDDITVIVAQVV